MRPGPRPRVRELTGRAHALPRAAAEAGAAGLLPKSSTLGVVCDAVPGDLGCFIVDRSTVEPLCSSALPEFAAGRRRGR